MLTAAEQRRADGEEPLCDCEACAKAITIVVRDFAAGLLSPDYVPDIGVAYVIRGIVLSALLDPETWVLPEPR